MEFCSGGAVGIDGLVAWFEWAVNTLNRRVGALLASGAVGACVSGSEVV